MLRYRGRYDHFSTVRNSQARIRDRFLTNSRLLTITVNGTDFITLKVKRRATIRGLHGKRDIHTVQTRSEVQVYNFTIEGRRGVILTRHSLVLHAHSNIPQTLFL